MLDRKDIAISAKVRYLDAASPYYMQVGTICLVRGCLFTVRSDDTEDCSEHQNLADFDLVKPAVKYRPIDDEDFVVGAHVVCVFENSTRHCGKTGVIREIISLRGCYFVDDDNGNQISKGSWCYRDSFAIIIDEPPALVPAPIDPVPAAKVQRVIVDDKPCPAYYYGPAACTCGKCSIGRRRY